MKLLSTAWNWKPLRGYKTYLAIFALVVWGGLLQQGYIDQATFMKGELVLAALGIAARKTAK